MIEDDEALPLNVGSHGVFSGFGPRGSGKGSGNGSLVSTFVSAPPKSVVIISHMVATDLDEMVENSQIRLSLYVV
jgi:hypothetical protein